MSVADADRERSFREMVGDNPRPALLWLAGVALLVAVEFGALMNLVMSLPWDLVADKLPGFIAAVVAPRASRQRTSPSAITMPVGPRSGSDAALADSNKPWSSGSASTTSHKCVTPPWLGSLVMNTSPSAMASP